MVARSERLLLRKARKADNVFLFQLMNSPGWLRYIGDRGIRSKADALRYIEDSIFGSYRELGFGLYTVELAGVARPIGLCGFLKRDYLQAPDLGFATLPEFSGQGLTFEAATTALAYARETLEMTTVFAVTLEENHPSRSLLEKCAFRQSGRVKPTPAQELLLYRRELYPRAEGIRPS